MYIQYVLAAGSLIYKVSSGQCFSPAPVTLGSDNMLAVLLHTIFIEHKAHCFRFVLFFTFLKEGNGSVCVTYAKVVFLPQKSHHSLQQTRFSNDNLRNCGEMLLNIIYEFIN